MLGGSLWVSMLRNGMGAALIMGVFLLLDRPRFPMKKTIAYYLSFGAFAAGMFSLWYLMDASLFIRFSGIAAIPVVGIFCILMSVDLFYLSIYKLTLGFYLLSVTVFLGVDISRLWLGGNLWADIALRMIATGLTLVLVVRYVRPRFMEGREFLGEVMDLPSAVMLIVIIIIAFMGAYWPDGHPLSVGRVLRIAAVLAMAGIVQWMTFRAYFYKGRAHYCQIEDDLLEMNELLLCRQLRQIREAYMGMGKERQICSNAIVNGILSVYETYAGEEGIQTDMHVDIDRDIAVRETDMGAILVSILEKAIHECRFVKEEERRIVLFLEQNKNKIVIQCRNACAGEGWQREYPESWRAKASSICNVISHYNGEMEFSVQDGMIVSRILLNTKTAADKSI